MVRLNRTSWQLALILLVALAARLAAGFWWQAQLPHADDFGFSDSESYWRLGQAIAQGRPYEYGPYRARVFRTPGYPVLLAAVIKLTGQDRPVQWMRATSALLATLAVGGVYWCGRLLFDHRTGLGAAMVAAVYPGAVAMGGFVLTEAPFSALMVLQLIFWYFAWQATKPRQAILWFLATGLIGGLATLVRPSWLLFTPMAIGIGLVFTSERKRHLAASLWLLTGLGLAMLPWWIRNAIVVQRFVPTTLQVGASLYDGLHPAATGASDLEPAIAREAALRTSMETLNHTEREYEVNQVLRKEAVAWAAAHPTAALWLAGTKFVRMWNLWPNESAFRSWLARLAVTCTYVPVLVMAILGAWKFGRKSWSHLLCVLPAVYLSLLHAVFVGSIRYRQPAMLLLIVLAVGAGFELLQRRTAS